MATVKYVGPFEAVDFMDNDTLVTVKHGEQVEVSDEMAESLLMQDIWEGEGSAPIASDVPVAETEVTE